MSFIGFRVPHETARLLSELDVPGTKDSTDHFHVTVIHLGDDVPIETLAEALVATFKVTSKTAPFTVSTSRVSCFPVKKSKTSPLDGKVPVICRIESDALHTLQQDLKASLKEAGVGFEDKFPEYKPHVTLAWADDSIEDKRIPTVEWGAHELVLWGGDKGDRKLTVTFPFSLKVASMPRRVLARFVGKSSSQDSPP
jgi:2'-5' RNA ligase